MINKIRYEAKNTNHTLYEGKAYHFQIDAGKATKFHW